MRRDSRRLKPALASSNHLQGTGADTARGAENGNLFSCFGHDDGSPGQSHFCNVSCPATAEKIKCEENLEGVTQKYTAYGTK